MWGARVMRQLFVFMAALWDVGLMRLCRRLSIARNDMGKTEQEHKEVHLHR